MASSIPGITVSSEIERRTVATVSWRRLPLTVVISFVASMDRTHVGFASFGLIAAGPMLGSLRALVAMSVATLGLNGTKPAVWPLPAEFLLGMAAAGGIALIYAIGNLGGFVGPDVLGWLKDATGPDAAGLSFPDGCALAAAAVAFFTTRPGAEGPATTDVAVAGPARSARPTA